MKKTLRSISFILIILLIAVLGYLKLNPPLTQGSIGTTSDKLSVIVALGNKNLLGNIHITDVSINANQAPTKVRMQVSNSTKGFIITDTYQPYEEEYGMKEYETITLEPQSAPIPFSKQAKAGSENPARIYGLSITEDTPIERINVTYRYLGISFVKTINV
ncbi:MAG: hypothetical protein WAM18_16595 [Halobacillus sp.]|uniref:hypothetical protein n=1 Tax=Halobacillus sp. TaxID=56800 RepID=UPI003BB1C8BE